MLLQGSVGNLRCEEELNTVPYLRINCSIIIFLMPSILIVTFTITTLDPGTILMLGKSQLTENGDTGPP